MSRRRILRHFSQDPSIVRFEPHVPRTKPDHRPAVWAIDRAHVPLDRFPRDCPRCVRLINALPADDVELR